MVRALSILAFAAFATLFFLPACQPSCSSHEDCDGDEVCIFSSGKCAATCDPMKSGSCSANASCDSCATSSCPACRDCMAACVEISGTPGGQGGW